MQETDFAIEATEEMEHLMESLSAPIQRRPGQLTRHFIHQLVMSQCPNYGSEILHGIYKDTATEMADQDTIQQMRDKLASMLRGSAKACRPVEFKTVKQSSGKGRITWDINGSEALIHKLDGSAMRLSTNSEQSETASLQANGCTEIKKDALMRLNSSGCPLLVYGTIGIFKYSEFLPTDKKYIPVDFYVFGDPSHMALLAPLATFCHQRQQLYFKSGFRTIELLRQANQLAGSFTVAVPSKKGVPLAELVFLSFLFDSKYIVAAGKEAYWVLCKLAEPERYSIVDVNGK